jgi:hypothetical protein
MGVIYKHFLIVFEPYYDMPRRRKGNKSGKKRKGTKRGRSNRVTRGSKFVSKIPGIVFPDSTVAELIFYTSPVMTNNGNVYANDRWKLNSAYDFDPTIGSTAIAGFSEAAGIYSMYRVLHVKMTIDFTNQEAFPATCWVAFNASFVGDPGANSSGAIDWMMNPYSKRKLCSQAGGVDRGRFSESMSLARLSGSSSYLTDDNFAALCTTNPATILYAVIGADPVGSNTFTTGKGFALSISAILRVQFYGRKFLQT